MGKAGRTPAGYARIGDDVAVIPSRGGKVVLKADMLVEHTDVPPGMTYRQAARKAVAMCVSDFAAKGVKPDSFMVSLGLRKGVTQEEVDGLGLGFRDAERSWGVRLVGGDTNEAEELVIDCVLVGFGDRLVTREGAAPGDRLVVTGPFGLPPAGLKILSGGARADQGFAREAKRSVLEPAPNLRLGLELAPYLSSSMDSSDGLARSIHTLARESKVGFEVHELPFAAGVEGFARANGLDPERLALEGGEEYSIVGTVSSSELGRATRAAERAGGTLLAIGAVTASKGKVTKSGKTIKDAGWTHLG
ncbi:MAG: thiamine-phosphate kinase [Nitrososphaerota archaeon]|nr:thiamine-phosphate kinase [Nitrososphaerota archaeon]